MLHIAKTFHMVTALVEMGFKNKKDFVVVDNAIAEWKSPLPQPTEAELAGAFLAAHKRVRTANLDAECEKAIMAGFTSASTGHTFGFNTYDQANLTAMHTVLVGDPSIPGVEWKTLNAGIVPLTRDQFMGLAKEALAHKQGQINKFWALKTQIEAATLVDEVIAVNW